MKMKHSNKFPIILKARNVLKMKWDYIVLPSFLCIKLELINNCNISTIIRPLYSRM